MCCPVQNCGFQSEIPGNFHRACCNGGGFNLAQLVARLLRKNQGGPLCAAL
jgi:hypothetical protein